MIKKIGKEIAVRIAYTAVLAISIFYLSILSISVLIKWMVKGNKIWKVEDRPLPPLILYDPAWGRHARIRLQDVKIHYVENGDSSKPLMLLIHGFPEFWFSWRHQLKHFAKDYWVVAMDLRGYGDSDKPEDKSAYKIRILEQDVYNLVKALGRDTCILVGHDWGGGILWGVASRHPEIVEKLIILNDAHPEAFKIKVMKSFTQFLKTWYSFAFLMPHLPELLLHVEDFSLFSTWLAESVTPEELNAYKYYWSQPRALTPLIDYYRIGMGVEGIRSLIDDKLPVIQVPTLIIWGEDDFALEKDMAELNKQFVRDVTVNYIPNGSHFIQMHKPNEVNECMEKFLAVK